MKKLQPKKSYSKIVNDIIIQQNSIIEWVDNHRLSELVKDYNNKQNKLTEMEAWVKRYLEENKSKPYKEDNNEPIKVKDEEIVIDSRPTKSESIDDELKNILIAVFHNATDPAEAIKQIKSLYEELHKR